MSRRHRNKRFELVEIIDFAFKGQSIGRKTDGEIILVEKTVPGDIVDVQTFTKKKKMWHARPVHWHHYSESRTQPICDHFGVCGGCKWQHVQYPAQLQFKEKLVTDALTRIGGLSGSNILPILPSPQIFHYRNKMEYSFSNKRWLTSEEIENGSEINNRNALGLHPPGFYDRVVAIDYCHLQDDLANAIRNFVSSYTTANQISYYDIQEHLGIMRSLVIRQGTFSNQIMVNVIFGEANDHIHDICQAIQDHFPAIQSINYCINTKWNDSTWDLDFHTFHGPGYIEEVINHRTYRIGPKSFFQTNSYQARNMFDQIKAYADQEPYAILYDLYCGAGSIGIYLADQGKTIIGIEEVDEAIGQAKENQKLNHLSNCSFYQGDVKLLMNDQLIHEHGKADLIIVDPPRAGLHAEVVHALLQIQAPRIIYVSCNPATQARDLKILQEKYNIIEHQPIDMFPHTHHTENITLLKIK